LLIFDVSNWSCIFGGKYLHSGCSPDTEPKYLHTICLNYFPHSFNMLKWYKINFSWIQASPQGPVVNTITLLVAYICWSPGFFSLRCRRPFIMNWYEASAPQAMGSWKWVEVHARALTDRLCSNRWPYQLGWGPVKVRVGCRQGSCKLLIVSKNVMCIQSCVILCWINSS
jgi:hypothetical protein